MDTRKRKRYATGICLFARVTHAHKVLAILSVLVLVSSCTERSVLNQVESYKAPPYPQLWPGAKETYDSRSQSGAPNPPTRVDALVCDLWRRMTEDLKINGISPRRVTTDDVRRAINIYLDKEPMNINGYRPWTHGNFLRDLTASERAKLETEVVSYIAKHGVRDGSQY